MSDSAGESYYGELANYFHPVARSEEVSTAPRAVRLLDTQIVLWRAVDGAPIAFKDVCVHRGTALSLGEVTAEGCLRCAYHGWEYDASGACTRIPALPADSTIPPKARAVRYRTHEAYGVVWVAIKDPVALLPAFPNNEWNTPGWRGFLAFSQTWQSSAGRMLENFCDWAHLPWVHEGLLGVREHAEVAPYEVRETAQGLTHTIEQTEPLGPDDLYSTQLTRNVFDLVLPFTIHLNRQEPDKGHQTLLSMTVAPASPTQSTLYLWITRNHTLDPAADQQFREFSEMVFAQDRRIVESQRPEEIPLDLREEIHLKVPDAWSMEYRRLLTARVADAAAYLDD